MDTVGTNFEGLTVDLFRSALRRCSHAGRRAPLRNIIIGVFSPQNIVINVQLHTTMSSVFIIISIHGQTLLEPCISTYDDVVHSLYTCTLCTYTYYHIERRYESVLLFLVGRSSLVCCEARNLTTYSYIITVDVKV